MRNKWERKREKKEGKKQVTNYNLNNYNNLHELFKRLRTIHSFIYFNVSFSLTNWMHFQTDVQQIIKEENAIIVK